MSGRSNSDDRGRRPKLELQRIRVDAQGYDSSGAYWGAGPDVFIATAPDGSDEITVRAANVAEAREKIARELARPPGAPSSEPRTPLGGQPPRKTRYEITWINELTRAAIRVRITHSRDYLGSGSDHVEVESIAPKRAPLPITETGYRSHFIPPLDLVNAGGPVTFVEAWLAAEARTAAWLKKASAAAQGDLFNWADAQGEVAARGKKPTRQPGLRKRAKSRPRRTPS